MPRWKEQTLEERFMQYVSPEPNSGCWLWVGSETKGYGKLGHKDHTFSYAHRISYELYKGDIPNSLFVLHKCDNSFCVNPEHLYCGTHAQNMNDMHVRKRNAPRYGEFCGKAKLKEQQVLEIRASKLTPAQLSKKYKIARETIYQILNRRTWTHLPK